jgi:hypothetical protein
MMRDMGDMLVAGSVKVIASGALGLVTCRA